jgi:hypothetical protein
MVTTDERLTMADESCVRIDPPETPPTMPIDEPDNGDVDDNGTGDNGTGDNGTGDNGTGDNGDVEPAEARSGTLKMSIVDMNDSIRVGETTQYLITVENDRDVPDKDIRISFTVPAKMKFKRFQADEMRLSFEVDANDSRTYHVTPIAELRAGESITVRVTATATEAGRVRLEVQVDSARLDKPIVAEEDTTVLVE